MVRLTVLPGGRPGRWLPNVAWRRRFISHYGLRVVSDHEGRLAEAPEVGEVRCESCDEMAPMMGKHLP